MDSTTITVLAGNLATLLGVVWRVERKLNNKGASTALTPQVATTEVAAATASTDFAELRDLHLERAAQQALLKLGYDVANLTYSHKTQIADFMASEIDQRFKADVTPNNVEAVLDTIQSELAASVPATT